MPGKPQFCNSPLHIILCAATVVLVIAITVLPAWAQNPVPPTARQAAASPAFAQRLAHASKAPSAPSSSRRASPQDNVVVYENGPLNGTYDAWTINFGYVVSNSFTLGSGSTVVGFDFYTWGYPGDNPQTVDWSITSAVNGGTVYGSGAGAPLANTIISTNGYDYQINEDTVSGLNVNLGVGTYYLNLQNAVTSGDNPLYWDENDGAGCKSPGCPSLADDNGVGTIGSETFDITGSNTIQPCDGGDPTLVYSFTGKQDGADPTSVTFDRGTLYGTAVSFIFKYAEGTVTRLYTFAGGADGEYPSPLVAGPDGTLYGTTSGGGLQNCNGSYCGQVFNLKYPPTACVSALCPWRKTAIYQFTGIADAYNPNGVVFDAAGNLYGIAAGGAFNQGAVYQLTPSSGGWSESIVHSFNGNDGSGPSALLFGTDGNLYGATSGGGTHGAGTVFELSSSASGWTETVLYNFQGQSDGASPYYLAQYGSDLYGLGSAVFMISPSDDGWVLSKSYTIDYMTHGRAYGLIAESSPVGITAGPACLGLTCSLQLYDYGEIFRLDPGDPKDGGWHYETVYTFHWWSPHYMTPGSLWGTSPSGGKYCEGAIWRY